MNPARSSRSNRIVSDSIMSLGIGVKSRIFSADRDDGFAARPKLAEFVPEPSRRKEEFDLDLFRRGMPAADGPPSGGGSR